MKLDKTLGTKDVVLLSVTAMIGLRWISLAAAMGNVSIILWLGALVLFFIPQVFAVMELTTRLPGEGGVYLWTKEAFGNSHGFMSGWCYWTNNLVYFPNLLVYIAGISVFIAGGGYESLGQNKTYILIFSLVLLWMVTLFNILGMRVGKWINNIGGIGSWVSGAVLVIFGFISLLMYGLANPMPLESFTMDIFAYNKFTFWATMCFGFTGIELASVMAGEVKDARKTIPKAAIITGFIVTGIYVLGTFALLVAVPANDINIITGILQGISAIGNKIGMGWATSVIALAITLGGIGGLMAWFTGAARMPFVVGIDNYLPKSFGKLHKTYNTPYIAVLVQAVIATLFILMSFIGSSVEEAYMILLDTTILVYFIPYVYMFAAYIVLRRRKFNESEAVKSPKNDSLALVAGTVGLIVTLISMVLSALPSPDSTNPLLYEIKVIGGALAFVLSGWIIYKVKSKTQ